MAGGGGQSQTTNSFKMENVTKDPWGPAIPSLKNALYFADYAASPAAGGADTEWGKAYKGYNPALYEGQKALMTNAGYNRSGKGALQGYAGVSDILGGKGLSAVQQQGLGTLSGVEQNLNPYASGQMIKANPYLESVLSKAMGDASDRVNAQFSAAGRYGSGAHAGSLGRELGNIESQARMADYNQQQQNQFQANQQLAALAAERAGIGQQGVGNIYAAAPALQQLFAAENLGAQTLADVGNEQTQYPWNRAANYSNIASQIGGLGGTSQGVSFGNETTKTSGGGSGVIGSILGGGMTGLSFLKNMGGLGGIGALFTGSDVRLKEDIQPVGKTFDGQNIYSYRYKAGGPKVMGLMAQEVLQHKPEAVAQDPESGMLMVNYDKAVA